AAVRANVAEESDVIRLMAAAFKDADPDGLVNCAGIYPVTPLLELTAEEWAQVIGTNLSGPFLVTREFARRLIADRRPGQVVNISSTASRLARPGIAHYGSSKAGLNQLTAIMAIELAPHGIRVNAVLPGVIGTEAVLAATRTPAGAVENEAKLRKIPQGRLGEPRDIAEMVAFLLSPASGYCTGGLFTVDGGFTLGIPAY
ncbi:MAG TPA: SDR family oxidoreductase, partial [bacterium]